MYTETCPKCLGYGTITGLCYKTMKVEKITCNKCRGDKVIHYKLSPELRERKKREKTARRKKGKRLRPGSSGREHGKNPAKSCYC